MKLSEKLAELRKEKNLSQTELADALNVSRQAVSRWETGLAAPSMDKLHFLAEFYGVTLDELFYSAEETPRPQEQAAPPQEAKNGRRRKPLWLCAAAVVVMLLIAVLIAVIDHKGNSKDEKEPVSIDDLQGVVIDPDETMEFEFERD